MFVSNAITVVARMTSSDSWRLSQSTPSADIQFILNHSTTTIDGTLSLKKFQMVSGTTLHCPFTLSVNNKLKTLQLQIDNRRTE